MKIAPVVALALCLVGPLYAASTVEKPNVLLIYLDDMGWAQPGCYGGKLAPTPNLDALAAGGARFTDGYSSACVCSPGRVGLMTGRYQQRTGHDANTTKRNGSELDRNEKTMAELLKAAGYKTGIFGKWHLGESPDYLPSARGFDESFGTLSNLGEGGFYRGKEHVEAPAGAPITAPIFCDEAEKFIDLHREQPWFCYLALNAVHAPHVASPEWVAKFSHIADAKRERPYAAMIAETDDCIGQLLAKLREHKLEENTLIFCISDNGGASPHAEMGGLQGRKWFVWEGGIRVSWIASWKGRIPAGQVISEPVIQLDVLPTALAAAGAEPLPGVKLDGVNLLPLMERKVPILDREAIFFRFGVQYAVRQGDWKLVKAAKDMTPILVNLADDLGEKNDLSKQHPDKVAALQKLWDDWNADNQAPRWEDKRWNGDPDRKAGKKARKKARN